MSTRIGMVGVSTMINTERKEKLIKKKNKNTRGKNSKKEKLQDEIANVELEDIERNANVEEKETIEEN